MYPIRLGLVHYLTGSGTLFYWVWYRMLRDVKCILLNGRYKHFEQFVVHTQLLSYVFIECNLTLYIINMMTNKPVSLTGFLFFLNPGPPVHLCGSYFGHID